MWGLEYLGRLSTLKTSQKRFGTRSEIIRTPHLLDGVDRPPKESHGVKAVGIVDDSPPTDQTVARLEAHDSTPSCG
jgi:hypothetical protein